MRKKYWRHIPCPTILILLSSIGIATAQSYPEIVIPVSDAEARQAIEFDRGWEMRYEIASWQSNGRIRIAKINGETLALAGELVQFTPFDDADPIVVMSDGLEPTEHSALLIWNKNNVSLKVYPVFEASPDVWYLGGDEKPEEVDRAAKAYGVFGAISTDGTRRMSEGKPLNGHHYAIRRLQNNSAPEYVMIFEPVRKLPKTMIDDKRSVEQREVDYDSPRMVAHRKTEEYRRQQENDDSYRDHLLAWEARYQARVKASASDK